MSRSTTSASAALPTNSLTIDLRTSGQQDPAKIGPAIAILCLTGMAVAMMQTLIVPLLPDLPAILHTSPSHTAWVVTVTLLCGAVSTPIAGRLGDMIGKREVLLGAVSCMVIGSAVCAMASALPMMLVGRGLQGAAIGAISLGISLMRDIVPAERLGTAVATMSATLGVGSAIGLPLSAIVSQGLSWHYAFWGSAVIGVLLLVGVLRVVPSTTVRTGGRFDMVGAIGLSAALICLLYGLSMTGEWGWGDRRQLALIAAGLVIVVVWAVFEKHRPDPLVNITTTLRRPVLLTNLASIMAGLAMYAVNLSMTQEIQAPVATGWGFGKSMVVAAMCSVPMGVLMLVFSPVSAKIIRSYGPKAALGGGLGIMAIGFGYAFAFLHAVWAAPIVAGIVGIGLAIAYAAMPTMIMASVPRSETASANSVNTLSRSLGTSVGAALYGTIIASGLNAFAAHPVAQTAGLSPFDKCFLIGAAACLLGVIITAFVPRIIVPGGRGEMRKAADDDLRRHRELQRRDDNETLAGVAGAADPAVFEDVEQLTNDRVDGRELDSRPVGG